jgi:hypothetical protein
MLRPYPWYEISPLTRTLAPYAFYSFSREHFDRCYQPEPADISLAASINNDDERYSWMSGDPIMREIVHMLPVNPAAFTKLAQINAEYMAGFRKKHYIDQARIHMMTACLMLGSHEDAAVTKKLLQIKTLELWARAWLRSEGKFSPIADEINATIEKLPPIKNKKFHWDVVRKDLGLLNLPEFGKQTYKPGPGIFSWIMRSDRKDDAISP